MSKLSAVVISNHAVDPITAPCLLKGKSSNVIVLVTSISMNDSITGVILDPGSLPMLRVGGVVPNQWYTSQFEPFHGVVKVKSE